MISLINGYIDFQEDFYPENQEYLQELGLKGQSPKIVMITCCDSRVDSTILTGSKPGDLFMIRNVANLVPLKVEHIIVLGHANCGGIRSLFSSESGVPEENGFIGSWMRLADNVRAQILADPLLVTQEEQISACEKRSIQASLENLKTFPWIQDRISHGQLELHGWFYEVVSGKLLRLNKTESVFQEISD